MAFFCSKILIGKPNPHEQTKKALPKVVQNFKGSIVPFGPGNSTIIVAVSDRDKKLRYIRMFYVISRVNWALLRKKRRFINLCYIHFFDVVTEVNNVLLKRWRRFENYPPPFEKVLWDLHPLCYCFERECLTL